MNRIEQMSELNIKSAVQQHRDQRNDVSKSLQEFRNLEYSFMLDNGYLLFELTAKKADNRIDYVSIVDIIDKSIKTNVSSRFQELLPLNIDEIQTVLCDHLIVGVASVNTTLSIVPGYHHMQNRKNTSNVSNTPNVSNTTTHHRYDMMVSEDQIVYLHPYVFHTVCNDQDNCNQHRINDFKWYSIKSIKDDAVLSNPLWYHWDIFMSKGDFTVLEDVKNHTVFRSNPELFDQFICLERKGFGEFVKMNQDNFIFRIRPEKSDPSIYESVIEIVYYFDVTERISHTNYTEIDRFEIRTGGMLSRSCNSRFAQTLYSICTKESGFVFNLIEISNYFRTINYDILLREWYPDDHSLNNGLPDNRSDGMLDNNSVNSLSNILTDDPSKLLSDVLIIGSDPSALDVKLNIKKIYSINVYKFDRIDYKNIVRIVMILQWMKELDLRGGFVMTDDSGHNKSGYMIVAGDEVVVTHRDKLGNLAIFQNRFKCLHWKKVKHYHYSNHDHISRLKYDKIPETNFVATHKEIVLEPKYGEILSAIQII